MASALVRALPRDDLVGEAPQRVTVAGTEILLARLPDGRPAAFDANCPHQRTHLGRATCVEGVIQCTLHGYVYDLETGENLSPAGEVDPGDLWRVKPGYLPVYPVEERDDGWIWVGPDPLPPPAAYDPDLERPPAPAEPARPVPPGGVHPTKTLRVAPGATFGLRLPTTPRPGFVWRVEISGPYLAVVEERFESGPRPAHVVRIAARGEGRATVTCRYARPWDTKPAEVRTYEVRVEFS